MPRKVTQLVVVIKAVFQTADILPCQQAPTSAEANHPVIQLIIQSVRSPAAGWLVAARSRPSQPPVLHVARAQQPQRLDDGSPATLPLQWDLLAATDGVAFDSRVEDALQDTDCDILQVGSAA
jgi:hypothetical protein